MAKKAKTTKKEAADPNEKAIANNRRARFNYTVLDSLECGLALVGSEVKSLRAGHISLEEAFARMKGDEVWLMDADIPVYSHASKMNHEPKRPRKMLLHRREINKFAALAHEKGLTLVPLKMYFKGGKAKVLLGLCKGKKTHDKRESLKKADTKRGLDRAMRGR